ncbi:MAG: sigma-70 family RNA polymerase sigma factor [Planctomycetes bacterium]|nr:sigma-70 family RNA polymerase sigma factor [Planctomycetota bacterium]
MTASTPQQATLLLQRMEAGDSAAQSQLLELLYREMHTLAEKSMREERANHTLQATALVHEVWLRLIGGDGQRWESRAHFLCTAAKAMRRVLVDHARRRMADKRGAGHERVTLDDALASYEERAVDVLALDQALEKLAAKDAELARIVELRFFAGLTTEETGKALGLSVRQVEGAWVTARGWLHRELKAYEQA